MSSSDQTSTGAHDDDLLRFEAQGAAPLPAATDQGHLENDGARIWYAIYGAGFPVILLHGGLGHGGNWGYQVAEIRVPVAIVQAERDEFIKPEHAEYLARSIPGAELIILPGVSHFAPLQRPDRFNAAILAFLDKLPAA
jgi:pimeloyl-ACP methyl ester carboxylesterase